MAGNVFVSHLKLTRIIMENTINSNELEIEKEPSVVNEENKKPNENKNYNAIDLTKFIMAIFVVIIHTNPLLSFTNGNTFWDLLIDRLTDLAVPFFFMASAFFLFKKMWLCYQLLKKGLWVYQLLFFPPLSFVLYILNLHY